MGGGRPGRAGKVQRVGLEGAEAGGKEHGGEGAPRRLWKRSGVGAAPRPAVPRPGLPALLATRLRHLLLLGDVVNIRRAGTRRKEGGAAWARGLCAAYVHEQHTTPKYVNIVKRKYVFSPSLSPSPSSTPPGSVSVK